MPESVRTYLTAGLSTVAAGAIIAAPVSSLSSPQAASPQPQVRNSDVRLEAVSTQLTLSGPAHRTETVHLFAEVSRGLASMKAANTTSTGRANPLLSSAASARPDVKTGVVTARNPAAADVPDNRQAGKDPNSAAVNAIDAPAIGGVLATVTQLALDMAIAFPATFVQGTVANLNQVILAAGTLDPNAVNQALQGFVTGERITLGVVVIGIQADLNSISDALEKLDTSDDGGGVASASMVTKTTRLAAATGVDAADAVDAAAPKENPRRITDAGSKRDVVAGKAFQDRSSGSTKRRNTAVANDGAVTTANPSDSKVSESSNPKNTGASGAAHSGESSGSRRTTATATTTPKSNASDSKAGASQSNHTFKKADHSGAQSPGKRPKSGGKHRKNG